MSRGQDVSLFFNTKVGYLDMAKCLNAHDEFFVCLDESKVKYGEGTFVGIS